jgi:hypothetical protein
MLHHQLVTPSVIPGDSHVRIRDRAARRHAAPRSSHAPGIDFDGHTLAMTGGVLRALWSSSYAAVSEVQLAHVAWAPHVSWRARRGQEADTQALGHTRGLLPACAHWCLLR